MALPKVKTVKARRTTERLVVELALDNGESRAEWITGSAATEIDLQRVISAELQPEYDLAEAKWDLGEAL